MTFEAKLAEFVPKLTALSMNIKNMPVSMERSDLIAEMELHLWKKWKNGDFTIHTDSYLIQSCWFHIKNFIRTAGNRDRSTVNLDEPFSSSDSTRYDILADEYDISNEIDLHIMIDSILENGLSEREKEVFLLDLEGHNLREIAAFLNISFVRVHKILARIRKNAAAALNPDSNVPAMASN